MEVEISVKLTLTPEEQKDMLVNIAQVQTEVMKAGIRAITDPRTYGFGVIDAAPARAAVKPVPEIKEKQADQPQTAAKPRGWPYPS